MNRGYNRKTAPKVKDGAVQKKNNHAIKARERYVVDRERPDKGFKHVISKRDIHHFVELIPDWGVISEGIESNSGDSILNRIPIHQHTQLAFAFRPGFLGSRTRPVLASIASTNRSSPRSLPARLVDFRYISK